jgi:hypothetical protein
MSWLSLVGAAALLLVAGVGYLAWYMHWEQGQTTGMAYYGRPLAGRRALKGQIRRRSLPARPMVRLLAALTPAQSTLPGFEFQGVAGPPRVSSPEVFARAAAYAPRPEDVFVTTQMRCGTTWMQQIVYEVVHGGRGDLSDAGHGHLYAVSPWIDAINSVSMEAAPVVGDRPTRLIKSHLPASISPWAPEARFIYVTRHPVGCFASIVDYYRALLGPVMPPMDTLVNWYCSPRMYWSPWPHHVAGWWDWAETRPNVLFVHFEDMKRDLGATITQVSAFLDRPLSPDEHARVLSKSSFAYMQEHEDVFEMAPPTMYSVAGGRFMAGGKASRHDDVTPAIRQRILDYTRAELAGRTYPASRFYPDLTS